MLVRSGNGKERKMGKAKLYKFWAPWCGPCRVIAPVLQKVLSERPNVEVIPVFVLEVNRKRFSKTGACSEKELSSFIDDNA